MSDIYIGIDPGSTGGICALGKDGNILSCIPMPVYSAGKSKELDKDKIADLITGATAVYIEKAQSMPKMGAKAMFSYGMGYGTLLTMFWAAQIPYTEVRPMTWRKVMLADMPKEKGNVKGASIKRAKQLKPGYDFRKSERCSKAHDGMIEAYLIAEHGRKIEVRDVKIETA